MRKTLNPHTLFDVQAKEIYIYTETAECFCVWKSLFEKKSGAEISAEDAFFAGLMMGTNGSLRKKYETFNQIRRR